MLFSRGSFARGRKVPSRARSPWLNALAVCACGARLYRLSLDRTGRRFYNTGEEVKTMNLPNALTIFRILLVPVFASLYMDGHTIASLVVYLLAGVTDMLDGYLARKWNQITDFGKLCDPLADKLMQLTMLTCLVTSKIVPAWALALLVAKELVMVVGAAYMLGNKVVVYANMYGKTATVLTIVSIIMLYPWHDIALLKETGIVVLYIALAVSILAMIIYIVSAYRDIRDKEHHNY